MTALVNIDRYEVPEPSEYSATTATIVDSARNAYGVVIGAVIRENVAKVSLKWNFITPDRWAALLAQFDGTRGGNFYRDVTFFNQDTNSWETREMYISDRNASIFMRNDDGSIKGYTGATFSLVEV